MADASAVLSCLEALHNHLPILLPILLHHRCQPALDKYYCRSYNPAVTPPTQPLEFQSGGEVPTTVGSAALKRPPPAERTHGVTSLCPLIIRITRTPQALAATLRTLLQYASLRGSHAFLDSSIPSFPRAVLRHVPRGSFQGKGTVAVSAGNGSAINRRVGCSHSVTLVGVST